MTAIEGDTLEKAGARSARDFLQTSPGVSFFQANESNNVIQIRGISALFGDATVGYYLDDLPFSLVNLQFVPDVNPYDLERVEVLRGPQGTLYGASSQGGTVRILTRNADPSKFEAKADTFLSHTKNGGTNYGLQGAINVPIVEDKAAVRLVGGYRDMSGFLDNPVLGERNINDSTVKTFRAKATILPIDDLTIRGSAWLSRTSEGSFPQSDENFERPIALREAIDTDYDLFNGSIEYALSNVTLYSATSHISYKTRQADASFGPLFVSTIDYEAFNEELRLASDNDGPFQWTAGFFYLDADHDQVTEGQLPTGPLRVADAVKTSRQWALFGEGHYALLDGRLELTGGLRYFDDKRTQETRLPSVVSTLAALGVPAKRTATFKALTPRFNVAYKPDRDTLFYVNVAKGFRSGIHQFDTAYFVPSLTFPDVANDESLWSYEVGSKLVLLDRTLTLEAALYYNDWSDLQQLTSQLVSAGGASFVAGFVENVGSARAIGADLGLSYHGIENLTLQIAGNINDSEYREDLPGLSGIKRGDRITFAPAVTLTASADYRREIASSGVYVAASTALQYGSRRYDYSGGVTFRSNPLTFWNMRVGVEGERWGLFLTGENLLNESGKVIDAAATVLDVRPRPRTIGLSGRLAF